MSNSTEKERIAWVDWAKVLLIYFVVVGHAGCKGNAQIILYAFHMPAFFIVSGYLYKPKDWRSTFKSLAIPIILYSGVNLAFKWALDLIRNGNIDIIHYATMSWKAYYAVAWGKDGYVSLFVGVWFIVVLALCRCLMGDVKHLKFVSNHYVEVALLMTLWMVCEKHFFAYNSSDIQGLYFYRVLSCYPFMALGKFLKERGSQVIDIKAQILPPPLRVNIPQ